MCTMDKNVAVSIDLENNETNLVNSLKKMVEDTPLTDSRAQPATIFRVPHHIRNTDEKAYKPKIVSLGPYHHNDQGLKALDDKLKLKWRYLKRFLARNSQKKVEDYLNQVKELEPQARIAYSEEVSMSSNDFVQMLLLDCSFVIELLLLLVQMETEKEPEEEEMQMEKKYPIMQFTRLRLPTTQKEEDPILRTSKWALPLLAHDVLMLENQLPFRVLRSLLEMALPDVPMSDLIASLFRFFTLWSSTPIDSNTSIEPCHHVLHYFHSCIIPRPKVRGDGGHRIDIADQPPPVLCARELREARVKLVRKKAEEAVSFLDITFKRGNIIFTGGRMEIPQLRIDDDTNSLLRNLIAFEQCYPKVGFHVSTYAWFVDRLIDTGIDVALLRQRDIIDSCLGSDKEVALLFNKLGREVEIEPENCHLWGVLVDVKKHCDKKYNRCCASLKHNYFSNPWAFISVIAAVLLFLLTITQTVFSVLSYVGQ